MKYANLIGLNCLPTGFVQSGINITPVTKHNDSKVSFSSLLLINYVENTSLRPYVLFTLFCLDQNFAIRHNKVWQCNSIKLCIYVVKLSKKWMKFRVWDNYHSIPLNMTAPVNKSNTNLTSSGCIIDLRLVFLGTE